MAGDSRRKPPSKAELRRELEQATRRFLRGGGKVEEVPLGHSLWSPGERPAPATQPLFTQPPQQRTPVDDVVATLEARRQSMKSRATLRRGRKPRPRRRTIYDDFGEPLRRVWVTDD